MADEGSDDDTNSSQIVDPHVDEEEIVKPLQPSVIPKAGPIP